MGTLKQMPPVQGPTHPFAKYHSRLLPAAVERYTATSFDGRLALEALSLKWSLEAILADKLPTSDYCHSYKSLTYH